MTTIFANQEKNFPENEHHDFYSNAYGWEYLGSDDFHDYYISHKQQLTSIVFGTEPTQYCAEPWSCVDPETWPDATRLMEIQAMRLPGRPWLDDNQNVVMDQRGDDQCLT